MESLERLKRAIIKKGLVAPFRVEESNNGEEAYAVVDGEGQTIFWTCDTFDTVLDQNVTSPEDTELAHALCSVLNSAVSTRGPEARKRL